MQERQVTIGDETFILDEPFLVLATQNPIEQDGTYALPESQLDRFMLNVHITYPTREEEVKILRRMSFTDIKVDVKKVLDPHHILKIRKLIDKVHLDEKVEGYILNIIEATRYPERFQLGEIRELIQFGASPRATIHLSVAAKAYAFIQGRGYVRPQDIKEMARDVLRHRIIESIQASSEKISTDELIQKILDQIEMP